MSEKESLDKPNVKLIGEDGNAFNIIAIVTKALRKKGLGDQVEVFQEEVMSGDYTNVLNTVRKYANIY